MSPIKEGAIDPRPTRVIGIKAEEYPRMNPNWPPMKEDDTPNTPPMTKAATNTF